MKSMTPWVPEYIKRSPNPMVQDSKINPDLWVGRMELLSPLSIRAILANSEHLVCRRGQLVLSSECVQLPFDRA